VLERRADGSLAKRSFPGWAAYRAADARPPLSAPRSLFQSTTLAPNEPWALQAAGGMDVVGTAESVGDFWWRGQLHLDARSGGLAFRLGDDGTGYFIEIEADRQSVSLQKWMLGHDASGRPTPRYVELRRSRLPEPLATGSPVDFELLLVGPYIECSLGSEVVLATLSAERTDGRFGAWADSGAVRIEGSVWAPMHQPQHG